ncbi:efflux RND transporter permease subunit [Anaerobacillus alkaliphilus]|nr:efflux RND transporter permease subunit [Anaerobacillus alkaliphilus]
MIIPKIAVKRPVTTIMMMLVVILLGIVSLTGLRVELMPNINPPVLAIMTTYPGAGPEEVAETVTKPIEEIVGTSSGLEMVQSRSASNSSLIIAQYAWGTDISEIRDDLTSSLGMVQLPANAMNPMMVKFDPTMMPIIQVAISNGEDSEHLQTMVEEVILPQLQSIKGVASVNVTGGFEEEILVTLTEEALSEHNLTQQQVVQMIQANNLTMPGGVIEEAGEKLNLRVLAKVETVEQLSLLPVSITMGEEEMTVVTLGDIANVRLAQKDVTSISKTNGSESILLSIQKEASGDTVGVSTEVQKRLDTIQSNYPELTVLVTMDQGEVIQQSVSNVLKALLFGAIFAIVVILLFLRSIKATIIVGIAIPFSIISTFVLMYFTGISLNIMSLGGLALGVGMLVDNAIVVLENIYSHLAKHKSRKEAAIKGTSEVAGAVTASMLTTLAVFLPIVFVGGMVGDLFKDLSFTVAFSLIASWAVALTVVPVFASVLLKPEKVKAKKELRFYKTILRWVLSHRLVTLLITGAVLVGSLALTPQIGTELMPVQDEGAFTINVELEEGATFEKTLAVIEEIEKELLTISEVDVFSSSVGNADAMMSAVTGSGENAGSITVNLVSGGERSKETSEMIIEVEEKISDLKELAQISINESNSMAAMSGARNEIEVMILGNNRTVVEEYTTELSERLMETNGITFVTDSIQEGKPEYQFTINKNEAFKYGLTAAQIGSFVNEALQGKVAATIFDTQVRVHMADVSNSKEAIENLIMKTPAGQEVALKDIGEITRGTGPVTVVRENQQDSVIVTATFEGIDLGTASRGVQTTINEMISELNIDTGQYTIKTAGGAEMMSDAFSRMALAVLLAIALVYMVMASQFESLRQPFIIMFTLPLAVIGVILGLFVTGSSFGITAFLGIIILVGIVLNNAIVFIDYTNQLRDSGLSVNDSLVQAGSSRLRPIIMTALTTMLGLLPLAIGSGEGTEIQAPMAIAVIGGLMTSTLLTLVVIPVIYSLFAGKKRKREIPVVE